MWVKPVFSGWDKSGTLISKFEENYRDIDIKNITVSHCDQTKCILIVETCSRICNDGGRDIGVLKEVVASPSPSLLLLLSLFLWRFLCNISATPLSGSVGSLIWTGGRVGSCGCSTTTFCLCSSLNCVRSNVVEIIILTWF